MRNGRNPARTSLFVRTERFDQLRRISERTGAPLAHMIRSGIDGFSGTMACRLRRPGFGSAVGYALEDSNLDAVRLLDSPRRSMS